MEERNSRSKTIPEYLVYYPDETTPAMKPLQWPEYWVEGLIGIHGMIGIPINFAKSWTTGIFICKHRNGGLQVSRRRGRCRFYCCFFCLVISTICWREDMTRSILSSSTIAIGKIPVWMWSSENGVTRYSRMVGIGIGVFNWERLQLCIPEWPDCAKRMHPKTWANFQLAECSSPVLCRLIRVVGVIVYSVFIVFFNTGSRPWCSEAWNSHVLVQIAGHSIKSLWCSFLIKVVHPCYSYNITGENIIYTENTASLCVVVATCGNTLTCKLI